MSKQLESVNTNIPIEVIDIDVFPEISVEYGIRSVPTLVMIEDNIEVKRVTGTKSQQELKEWVTYGN
jgi:thioredoxin-like negative regulator of GroEL